MQLRLEGRLLPDSAYTTYFGKPAFHAYGNGNTNPTNGGLSYGQYMKTHNINPHSGANQPEFGQTYAHAMLEPHKPVSKGKSKSPKRNEMEANKTNWLVRKPCPPRQAKSKRPLTAKQIAEQKERKQITQEKLVGRQNIPIIKPQIQPDIEIANEREIKKFEREVAKIGRDARKEKEYKRLGKRSNRPGDASQRSVGFETLGQINKQESGQRSEHG